MKNCLLRKVFCFYFLVSILPKMSIIELHVKIKSFKKIRILKDNATYRQDVGGYRLPIDGG